MYALILAWRYVRSRLVNLVAILAVSLALTVQIVVMAVLDGMLEDMRQRIRDLGEQITVSFFGELPSLQALEQAEAALKQKVADVRGVTPLVQNYAVLEKDGFHTPVLAYGIDLAREVRFSQLSRHLLDHKLDPEDPRWAPRGAEDAELPRIFLGAQVAERLGALAGDTIYLSYVQPGTDDVERTRVKVASTFRSGSLMKDRWAAYVPIDLAQKLFFGDRVSDADTRVSIFSIWLEHPDRADALAEQVFEVVREEVNAGLMRGQTWQQRWRTISEGMAYENRLQEVILVLMNLSGGFCVFAILATLVSRRVRDVGLLRCLGAGRGGVIGVFLLVGLIIGLAGSVLGLAGGYALSEPGLFFDGGRPLVDVLHERILGEPLYPPRMFLVGGVKPIFGPKVLLYALGATVISVLAALYPAVWAGTREPVEVLQHE